MYNFYRHSIYFLRTFAVKLHFVSRCCNHRVDLLPDSDFLLSNNHINAVISHSFDFDNEELLAYYVSFIKTLSFKLNSNTIHFFFNEVGYLSIVINIHLIQTTREFPLFTEALKFYNHSESMVRIAVRTVTLNIFRVC